MLMGAQYYMHIFATIQAAPANATTYYLSQWASGPALTQGVAIGVFLRSGMIKRVGINVLPLVVAGGAQLGTLSLLLNGVTEYIISSGVDWSLAFAAYGGEIAAAPAVNIGDYYEIKIVTPTWVPTPPQNVLYSGGLWIENQ